MIGKWQIPGNLLMFSLSHFIFVCELLLVVVVWWLAAVVSFDLLCGGKGGKP